MADAFAPRRRSHFPLKGPLCDLVPTHAHLAPRFPTSSERLHAASASTHTSLPIHHITPTLIRNEALDLIYALYTVPLTFSYGFGTGPTCPQYLFFPLPHPDDDIPFPEPGRLAKLFGKKQKPTPHQTTH